MARVVVVVVVVRAVGMVEFARSHELEMRKTPFTRGGGEEEEE